MKKSILFLVPNIGIGGQQRVTINTANILKNDYSVSLSIFCKQDQNYEYEGNLINLKIPPLKGKIRKLISLLKRVQAIKTVKKELDNYCTISFGNSANLVNILSKSKGRSYVSIRGYRSLSQKRISQIFWRYLYKRVDGIISVSEKMSREIENLYSLPKEKVFTIYNPYDINLIQKQSEESIDLYITSPTIVSVGRMAEIKGYHHLLNALKIASVTIENIRLLLVGDGVIKDQLVSYAKEIGVGERVTFVGFQSNPYSYIVKCNVYVLSSINEGFPNALVEAMSCGVPVIAADCKTGPREILTAKFQDKIADNIEYADYGVLVPPFQADNSDEIGKDKLLSEAIVELLTNPERYKHYKDKSLERAKEFSYELYKENIVKIIESID
jgi:glycosyltransferase involved in cell wall biosynthesis